MENGMHKNENSTIEFIRKIYAVKKKDLYIGG